jgi:hypothetical protein
VSTTRKQGAKVYDHTAALMISEGYREMAKLIRSGKAPPEYTRERLDRVHSVMKQQIKKGESNERK